MDRNPCPKCGRAMGSGSSYCVSCGTKLPPPANPLTPEERAEFELDYQDFEGGKCGKAHHEMVALLGLQERTSQCCSGGIYCPECGADLSKFVTG